MATTTRINDFDFDCPFAVAEDGTADIAPGVHAPDVTHVEGQAHPHDIEVSAGSKGDRWEALAGYSNQQSYRGAVLHPCEFIGGGLERDLLAAPGVYVATEVSDPEDPESLVGWTVLRYLGHDDDCGYCAAGEPMQHTYQPAKDA